MAPSLAFAPRLPTKKFFKVFYSPPKLTSKSPYGIIRNKLSKRNYKTGEWI